MKALAFLAVALWCAFPLRADTDILANSDFTDGKAHWHGDGQDASSIDSTDASASLSNAGSAKGMIVHLANHWTSVSQTFNTQDDKLTFSMTYTTSSDYVPENFVTDYFWSSLGGFLGIKLKGGGFKADPNSALVVIADLAQNTVFTALVDAKPAPNGAVTSSATIDGLLAHEEKTLFVIFPDGTGSITFSNISLDKADDAPAPSQNPFQN